MNSDVMTDVIRVNPHAKP